MGVSGSWYPCAYINALYPLVAYPWWSDPWWVLDHDILVRIYLCTLILGRFFIDPLWFLDHCILERILKHFKTLGSLLFSLGGVGIMASLCVY